MDCHLHAQWIYSAFSSAIPSRTDAEDEAARRAGSCRRVASGAAVSDENSKVLLSQITPLSCLCSNHTVLRHATHLHQLTELPAAIGSLTALTTLDLCSNQLKELPAAIGSLSALTTLELGSNQLTELPAEIGSARSNDRYAGLIDPTRGRQRKDGWFRNCSVALTSTWRTIKGECTRVEACAAACLATTPPTATAPRAIVPAAPIAPTISVDSGAPSQKREAAPAAMAEGAFGAVGEGGEGEVTFSKTCILFLNASCTVNLAVQGLPPFVLRIWVFASR